MDRASLEGFAAIAAGLALFFLLYAIYAPRRRAKKRDLAAEEIFGSASTETPAEGIGKFIQPVLKNFMPNLPNNIMTEKREKSYTLLLRHSGNPWKINAEELFVVQIAFGIMAALIGTFLAIFNTIAAVPIWAFPVIFGLLGFAFPWAYLRGIRDDRTKDIEKNLPEALDLLTVLIRSGQTFEPALRKVTDQIKPGFLRTELVRLNVELQAGRTLTEALRSFAASSASESADSFAKTIIQAQRIGADITETLEHQANFARETYENRIEKMISRLSTTMFIPLSVCMLPAMVIISAAPSLSSLLQYLG